MRICVLDCSFAMSWVFEDEADDQGDALLDRLRDDAVVVVPAVLWGLEIASCLHRARQRGRLTKRLVEEKRRLLSALPVVELIPPHGLSESCFELSASFGLTSYDGAYFALAIEERLPLATRDRALVSAARTAGLRLWGEG